MLKMQAVICKHESHGADELCISESVAQEVCVNEKHDAGENARDVRRPAAACAFPQNERIEKQGRVQCDRENQAQLRLEPE